MNFDAMSRIKARESEHQARITNISKQIESLRDEKEKLNIALSTLRELNLSIPEEYYSKLSDYDSDIEMLESQIEREQILLDYLQSNILPLIEKKPPIAEIARKIEEITPVEVKKMPSLSKPVAELAAPVEAESFAKLSEFPFSDRYYKWIVIGAICLLIIAVAALFYISQWFIKWPHLLANINIFSKII